MCLVYSQVNVKMKCGLYIDTNYLHMFLWEGLKILTPQSNEFSSVEKVTNLKLS